MGEICQHCGKESTFFEREERPLKDCRGMADLDWSVIKGIVEGLQGSYSEDSLFLTFCPHCGNWFGVTTPFEGDGVDLATFSDQFGKIQQGAAQPDRVVGGSVSSTAVKQFKRILKAVHKQYPTCPGCGSPQGFYYLCQQCDYVHCEVCDYRYLDHPVGSKLARKVHRWMDQNGPVRFGSGL